jgi:vitamin B12 transporter
MRRIILGALIALAWLVPAHAEQPLSVDEVVVTASKIPEAEGQTTSSVTVVRREEIEASGATSAVDVLRAVPELQVVQTGGVGKVADVILRGASPAQTVILIDGVKVKSTTTGAFDFSGLMAADIERVEIVKGPQSTMYGSDAMGGVINIITRQGKGPGRIDVGYEFGSNNTSNPTLTLSGGDAAFNWRVTGSHLKTDGISAFWNGAEDDGYENYSASARVGILWNPIAHFEFTGGYTYDISDLDSFGADDPNAEQISHKYHVAGTGTFLYAGGVESIVTIADSRESIRNRDPDTAWNVSDIITKMNTFEVQNNFPVAKNETLTVGYEYRKEEGENLGAFNEYIENNAVYANAVRREGGLAISIGARQDSHSQSGDQLTWRVGVLHDLKRESGVRYRASYATGYHAPTINQLFYTDPWGSMGNPNLKPEQSEAWEVGMDMGLSPDMELGVVYFNQRYSDLIQWQQVAPFVWQPVNVSRADVEGVEGTLNWKMSKQLALALGYTWLDTYDHDTRQSLNRRWDEKFTAALNYIGSGLGLHVGYTHVGDRTDTGAGRVMGAYGLLDANLRYAISQSFLVYVKGKNLMDEEYEEAADYGTSGAEYFGGVQMSF